MWRDGDCFGCRRRPATRSMASAASASSGPSSIPDSTYARRSYITQPVPRIVAAPLLLTRERFGARQDLSSIEAPAGLFVEIGACWFSGA